MQLVAALIAGIRGAENGTATFVNRGTASASTLYSSFEGDSFSGNVVTLDSSGRGEIYVNALVDCTVKDSDGVTVISFTEGAAATVVEYDGQSFTGTPYAGGPSAASEPTTLQSILNLWYTSAGAVDWKVSVNGSATTLSTAFAALGTLTYFNVKSTAYGATGDGTTDDTSAINAAISAAGSAGGVVFFPAGTYRITSALTPNGKVDLMGVSPGESVIQMDHASNNAIAYSASSSRRYQAIQGLRIEAAQAHSGTMVLPGSGGGSTLLFRNCQLGSSAFNKHLVGNASGYAATAAFDHCNFFWSSTTGKAVYLDNTASSVARFVHCNFNPPASHATDQVYSGTVIALGTKFNTASTGYSTTCINMASSNGTCLAVACEFIEPSSGTVTAFTLPTLTVNTKFNEGDNSFGPSVTLYSFTAVAAATSVRMGSRELRHYRTTDNSATVSIPADQYGSMTLRRSSGAAQTLNFVTAQPGARFQLVVFNNSGGALTGQTYGSNVGVDTATDPTDGNVTVHHFVCCAPDGTTLVWVQAGVSTNFAPS